MKTYYHTTMRWLVLGIALAPVGMPAQSRSVDLPFSDSFAGASFGDIWQVETVAGNITWEASGPLDSQLPRMSEYDGDGGMAVFKGWDGVDGDAARLVGPAISKASSTSPIVSFMFGHSGARASTDKVQVQVSCDGGQWIDVANALIPTYIPEIEDGGWTYYKYALDSYIKDCETYRVGFLGICERTNVNIPIDDVQIYNLAEKDVTIINFEVPEHTFAGNDIEIALTLENLGGSTLKASDYSVEIDTDFPVEPQIATVEIPSLGQATIVCKLPVTAEEVLDGPDYRFSATVNVAGNATGDKLSTAVKNVELAFLDSKKPGNLQAVFADDNSFSGLAWESVKDLEHTPISISENFNDLQARMQVEQATPDGKTEKVWVDGVKGNFNGLISIDLDKQDGSAYYSTSGSEFQVFKDFMTGSMPQGHSGQYIGLTLPGNIQQDDWLITPALDAAEGGVINFGARIAYIHRESDSYNNSLEVLYATGDYNRNNPSAAFTKSLYSNTSKATTGDLPHDGNYHWLRVNDIPAEAKYVAIHFNTKSGMQTGVWVDRLTVTETDPNPLAGYHIYRRGTGRLTTESLTPQQLAYTFESEANSNDKYYVTAIYANGESEPSNLVDGTSSLRADTTHDAVVQVQNGAIVVAGLAGHNIEVYNIVGVKVASVEADDYTRIELKPGVYIVAAGEQTAKVLVK